MPFKIDPKVRILSARFHSTRNETLSNSQLRKNATSDFIVLKLAESVFDCGSQLQFVLEAFNTFGVRFRQGASGTQILRVL